jgi:long-chain fatty acid transport protein
VGYHRRPMRTLLLLAALVLPASASAGLLSPADPFGLHARDMGTGRALSLFAPGFTAALANPAALALNGEGQLSLGYLYARPGFTLDGLGVSADNNNIPMLGLKLSLAELTSLGRQISFALAFGLDDNMGSMLALTDGNAPSGQFLRQGRRQLLLAPGFGVQLTDWLYLGAGAQISVAAGAQMQFNTTLAGQTSNEGVVMGGANRMAPVAGALVGPWNLNEQQALALGFAYRGAGYYLLNVDATASATVADSPLTTLPIKMSFVDAYRPTELSFGAQYRISRVTVGAEVQYAMYRDLNRILQSEDTVRADAGLEFGDVISPRLGVEVEAPLGITGRAGYGYEPSPLVSAPPSELNGVDNTRHVLSLGLGLKLDPPVLLKHAVSFDGAYQLSSLSQRQFTFTQDDGAQYDVQAAGIVHAFNATVTFRF